MKHFNKKGIARFTYVLLLRGLFVAMSLGVIAFLFCITGLLQDDLCAYLSFYSFAYFGWLSFCYMMVIWAVGSLFRKFFKLSYTGIIISVVVLLVFNGSFVVEGNVNDLAGLALVDFSLLANVLFAL